MDSHFPKEGKKDQRAHEMLHTMADLQRSANAKHHKIPPHPWEETSSKVYKRIISKCWRYDLVMEEPLQIPTEEAACNDSHHRQTPAGKWMNGCEPASRTKSSNYTGITPKLLGTDIQAQGNMSHNPSFLP